jgi:zinc transporter ZupT
MYSLLLLSFCSLLIGPALFGFATRFYTFLRFLDAFVLCSIFSLVVFHILPESIAHGGIVAIGAASLGFIAPIFIGRFIDKGRCNLHHSLISIASIGLIAHAILDGIALASTQSISSHQATFLGIAVVLHRLPEGIGIWRITQSSLGAKAGIFTLAIVMLATSLGFFFGESWITHTSEQALITFEALMAGVLMHVVFHRHHLTQLEPNSHSAVKVDDSPWITGAGAFCGFFLVICLSTVPSAKHSHSHTPYEISLAPHQEKDIICCLK